MNSHPLTPSAATSLASPPVRVGVMLPAAVSAVYAVATGVVADVELFLMMLVAAVVLGVVAITQPWARRGDARAERVWQVLSGTFGVALAAPFLVLALDIDVERFTLLFALIIVLGAYSYPRRLRLPLCLWALAVWGVALWWGGVHDLATLSWHLGGGGVLLAVGLVTANVLFDAVDVEAANRAASEQRAHLLASVLRTNSLEPSAVLRAVVTGMVDVGFDAVTIRELDEAGGNLRLVDGHRVDDLRMPIVLPLAEAHLTREALSSGRPVVVDDYDRSSAVLHRGRGLCGTVVVPVQGEGEPTAVVTGASSHGPLSSDQVEAAALLAEQAGLALDRARSFEADRATVDKLSLLDLRTQDFVSTVSHELRTPLTVIQGLGQTLLRRWDDLGASQRQDLLQRIDANTDRLAVMVRSLLDTSAVERGELTPSREPVPLWALAQAVAHRLEPLSSDHAVEVDVPKSLVVEADPALVDHVLENLLANVVKHTPPGTRTWVRAQRVDGKVRVSVRDDGPGIPPEDLPHVLDRFYRGGSLTARPAGGLGLGLALARAIVRSHGSTLEVDSSPETGTEFRFLLPDASVSPPSARRP